jgi:hypothetical protein
MNVICSKKNMFIETKILKNEFVKMWQIVPVVLKTVCMKLIHNLVGVCYNMLKTISYAHSAGNEYNNGAFHE